MKTIERPVKLLFAICAACGNEVVGDNTGSGRAWQHLATPDDHTILFGTRVADEALAAALAWPKPGAQEEAADEHPPMPAPGTPRDIEDAELGDNRSGKRQIFKLAKAQGFDTHGRFVRGPVTDQWGRYSRTLDRLYLVGSHPDGRRFLAAWETAANGDWGFDGAFCHGVLEGKVSSARLKTYLRSPRDVVIL